MVKKVTAERQEKVDKLMEALDKLESDKIQQRKILSRAYHLLNKTINK